MDPNESQDQMLACVDCGVQFAFSAKDQAFYKERGFNAPRRCKNCRQKRKGSSPGGGGGGGGGYGGGGSHGGGAPTRALHACFDEVFGRAVCNRD